MSVRGVTFSVHEHAPVGWHMDEPRRRPAAQGPDRSGRVGCGRAPGRRPAAVRDADGRLPRPPRPRHDPDLHHARRARRRQRRRRRRAAARPLRPRPRRRRDRDEAERLYAEQAGALRDALVGADTVLVVWQEPFEDLAQRAVDVDRRIGARRPAARPPAAADRAGGARQADGRDRRVQRAAAGRGPAADGHRLRAAGRRPRLSAA